MTAGSAYFHRLDRSSQERYILKLEVAGLAIKDDPYSPSRSGERNSDICYWMKIKYADILSYFNARPGTFTCEQSFSWRQLEAYN